VTSFIATMRQPLVYQSKTTLMIGRAITDPNPNSGEFYLEQQLASIYADIGNRELVRTGTMQALGINWLPTYSVRALPNTQLIEISVTDTVPVRAQAVANELAHQLILQSPTSLRTEDQDRQNFIDEQLATLQQQIKDTQNEIEKLNLQMGTLNSARQIADIQTQISGLETKVTNLQSAYASLAATSSKDATNSLSVIEPAGLPSTPIGPKAIIVVLLASVIGLTLAGLGAYTIEALDDSIKSNEEISRLLDVPIIGSIPTITDKESRWDFIYQNPRSPITDAFRMTRANIEFLSVDKPIKTILMTSPNVSEGKSTIASNLAFCFAQNEKKVILMDADFRRPVLHTAAHVSGEKGLSDVFLGTQSIDDVIVPLAGEQVFLIPAGTLPPNPTELLGSKRMEIILKEVKKKADLVIIDAPPLILADALILSKFVDGVLVVIRLGRTRKKSILTVKKQLEQAGTPILGILVNQASTGDGVYYNRYYSSDEIPEKKKNRSKDHGKGSRAEVKRKPQVVAAPEMYEDPNPTPPFVDIGEEIEINDLGFPNFHDPETVSSDQKPIVNNAPDQRKY
jgi:non-specific protein-tyrosine kinase